MNKNIIVTSAFFIPLQQPIEISLGIALETSVYDNNDTVLSEKNIF